MYFLFLHIGDGTDIFISDIVMLINLSSSQLIDYPDAVSLSDAPKTLVVTNYNDIVKYYMSGIRVSTLMKRIMNASK